jgi:hypothetical protein
VLDALRMAMNGNPFYPPGLLAPAASAA